MNKAIWGVLGLLIVIVLGAFFVSRNQVEAPTTPTATETPQATAPSSTDSAEPVSESMTVTYANTGFSPTTITVKVGDTVTFKNTSTKMMQVASAPHPTHTAYSGFDAKAGTAAGGSYMFTFTKAGSWSYHNHLNPTDTGTVVVE